MKNSIDKKIFGEDLFGGLLAKSILNTVEEELINRNYSKQEIKNSKEEKFFNNYPIKKKPKLNYIELYMKGKWD